MKIQLYSSTIRRKEMDAVLSCLVEEKTGPGELNLRLVQSVKEFFVKNGIEESRITVSGMSKADIKKTSNEMIKKDEVKTVKIEITITGTQVIK